MLKPNSVKGMSKFTPPLTMGLVENIASPLMQNILRLDESVDKLAKDKPMEKILRS